MWTEKDVIAMVRGYPDMPKVEQIFKYGDSGVVGIVVDGTERCVAGIDPEELPTKAANQIIRAWLWG